MTSSSSNQDANTRCIYYELHRTQVSFGLGQRESRASALLLIFRLFTQLVHELAQSITKNKRESLNLQKLTFFSLLYRVFKVLDFSPKCIRIYVFSSKNHRSKLRERLLLEISWVQSSMSVGIKSTHSLTSPSCKVPNKTTLLFSSSTG